MKYIDLKLIIAFVLTTFFIVPVSAQVDLEESQLDPEYTQVLIKRVDKFLKDVGIKDPAAYERVRDIVVGQYQAINWIEEQRDEKLAAIKANTELAPATASALKHGLKSEADMEIFRLHTHFLAQLQTELSPEQVDGIKDGMTYGVLDRTYGGYLNLLPKLSDEEKRYILASLLEARELAMDKGSSDAKHATFGKFKGRINNYLSQRGYNLKQAEMELKERENKKKKERK
ncbi:DUF3826 domain-containing protein [Flavilitoribacter nigricans]|uniref:DUF3826 domain-containing protein n=1 Tax=Flavilitoribacter nigricans (strain ATCC 23147 / DSM 23189 / NBRC 102662 / NCIMB 1420 / SS-2) TaxID=1122177 RepID=A0A2D0N1P5_FLAN2|nr:DUF3826 domain-containing protein [Flavilitoribacter nigricans]PHN02434.1 hypothetical protein CRP01_32140 [Flavilitoribacter nigricans DSM 23189 = NBRC 102662]